MADIATRKPIPLVNNIIPDGALNTLTLKVNVRLLFYIVEILQTYVAFAVRQVLIVQCNHLNFYLLIFINIFKYH